jgi:hypothetical protein
MWHPEAEPMLRRIGGASGYHGFAAIDWILDGDGHLQLIELNARPVPAIHLAPLGGVDFSRALRDLFSGNPKVQSPPEPQPDAVVAMFPEDLWRSACERELSVISWLPRPGRFTDVPWHDPPLLYYHLRRIVRSVREVE